MKKILRILFGKKYLIDAAFSSEDQTVIVNSLYRRAIPGDFAGGGKEYREHEERMMARATELAKQFMEL